MPFAAPAVACSSVLASRPHVVAQPPSSLAALPRPQRRHVCCAASSAARRPAAASANGTGGAAVAPEPAAATRLSPGAFQHSDSASEEEASGSMIGTLLIKCPDSKGVVASVAQVRGWRGGGAAE